MAIPSTRSQQAAGQELSSRGAVLPKWMQQHYMSSSTKPWEQLTCSSTDITQYEWRMSCGQCTRLLQVRSVLKSMKRHGDKPGLPPCLLCKVCGHGLPNMRSPSFYERTLHMCRCNTHLVMRLEAATVTRARAQLDVQSSSVPINNSIAVDAPAVVLGLCSKATLMTSQTA